MQQRIYFTADSHFGHKNIILYCKRPFKTVEEMDETLIANINAVVQPEDILYHLGDWSLTREKLNGAEYYLNQINCRNVTLIAGNHDPHNSNGSPKRQFAALFPGGCFQRHRIKVDVNGERQTIVLDHFAMRVWDKSHHGSWHLYGHSHGTLFDDPNSLSFDVGVDCHDFKPVSLDRVAEIMETKSFKPIDHHGA